MPGFTPGCLLRAQLPHSVAGAIVLVRIEGTLREGSVSDIHFKDMFDTLQGAVAVLRNTSGVMQKEFADVQVSTGSLDEIEERLAREHAGKTSLFEREREIALTRQLMAILAAERNEGEKVADFEKRVETEARLALDAELGIDVV